MACSKVGPDTQMLLVSMPSKIVYADVLRMYVVLRALNLPVIGLVENMAYSICQKCHHEERFSTKIELPDVVKLMQLPIFHHFHALNESSYPHDYKQGVEKEYFANLASKLIEDIV
jgi:Mrp family chromosome partitioning ATPase